MELELSLDPDDAARLLRLALLAPLKSGRVRSRAVRIVWHDSPDRSLAQQGLALAEQRPGWRLERLHPDMQSWPPGLPAPVLATARDPASLGHTSLGQVLAEPLVPIAAFDGRQQSLALAGEAGPIALTLLAGTVHTVAGGHRISRLVLAGAVLPVQALATALCEEVRLAVPRASLAAEAFAIASGVLPQPRRLGAPELPAGLSVADAFAHVVGHLTDVILHFAPSAADARDGPEPVHQMRVAVRRLRSAIKVFRPAVHGATVDAADVGLKALGARLAPTRDWDVFVTETLAAVAGAFADEPRLQRLLAAAQRRRRACHDALRHFLDDAEFRRLGIALACLAGSRDWQAVLDETQLAELAVPLNEFAARVLNRRSKKLRQIDDGLADLAPADLHAVRLRAKRLRYAAEIFAPMYPAKPAHRFIRRLSALQNQLGTLNDGAVATTLLHELAGTSGRQAFASGLVLGFVGAHSKRARKRSARAWQKFQRAAAFWE